MGDISEKGKFKRDEESHLKCHITKHNRTLHDNT